MHSLRRISIGDVILVEWPGEEGVVPFYVAHIDRSDDETLIVFGDGGVVGTEAEEDFIAIEYEGEFVWVTRKSWPSKVSPLTTRDDAESFLNDWFGGQS